MSTTHTHRVTFDYSSSNRNSINNNIKRLKSNLKDCMERTGKTKFKTDLFSFGIQANGGKQPVLLNCSEQEVPMEYQRVKYSVDMDAIRRAIEAGEYIGFAELGERGTSLRIR